MHACGSPAHRGSHLDARQLYRVSILGRGAQALVAAPLRPELKRERGAAGIETNTSSGAKRLLVMVRSVNDKYRFLVPVVLHSHLYPRLFKLVWHEASCLERISGP